MCKELTLENISNVPYEKELYCNFKFTRKIEGFSIFKPKEKE